MNVEQLINTKSKQEAAFIMYSKCINCHYFCEDTHGAWKCISSWNENYCRNIWDNYLKLILDKNNYNNI